DAAHEATVTTDAARRLGHAAGALARRGAHRRVPVAAPAAAGRLADRVPVQLLLAAGGQDPPPGPGPRPAVGVRPAHRPAGWAGSRLGAASALVCPGVRAAAGGERRLRGPPRRAGTAQRSRLGGAELPDGVR